MLDIRTIFLAIFLAVSVALFSQETVKHTFTLEEAIAYAFKNTAEMKNAELDINYAQKDVKEVLAGGFPQINGKINFQNYLGIPVNIIQMPNPQTGEMQQQEFKFGTDYVMSAGVSATQMLFDPNFFIGLKASKLYTELMERSFEQTKAETRNKVTNAYFSALISHENLSLLEENLKLIEKIYFETQQLYKNGFVEQIEVDRLSLSRNNLVTQISNLKRQQTMLNAMLKFQMGMALNDTIILTESLSSLETDADQLLTADFNYQAKPEYQVLTLQKDLTGLNVKNIRSNYYPKANLFGTYERNAMRDEFNFFDFEQDWFKTAFWGVGIQIPIFDSFKKSYQIQKEQINYQKIDNLQFQLKNALFLEVTQVKTQYINALDQLENQRENLDLAKRIYDTSVIKYNQGVGSSLEVNNAENTYFQTQSVYINALYDLLVAKSNLEKALGKY